MFILILGYMPIKLTIQQIKGMIQSERTKYWKEHWDSNKYVEYMAEDDKKHIRILALFAKLKTYNFDNYSQIEFYIKRYTRTAKRLEAFPIKQIENVLTYLLETANYKVALETIEKFILEDVGKLGGEEAIILLKSGEAVHDVKRLQELEKQNEIYWNPKQSKWYEYLK